MKALAKYSRKFRFVGEGRRAKWLEQSPRRPNTWVYILALLSSIGTMGSLLNLSVPQFLTYKIEKTKGPS